MVSAGLKFTKEKRMDSQNRNVLIFIVVALGLLVLCCCAAAVVAGAASFLYAVPVSREGSASFDRSRTEMRFDVGEVVDLTVENFAGSVTVRAGSSGEVRVAATKKSPSGRDLNRIQVEVDERDGGLRIKTLKPSSWNNVSVELEITTPPDTRLDLHTGAGSVEARGLQGSVKVDTGAGSVTLVDVTGEIEGHSGAGSIDVRGADGQVRLDSGAGSIDYEGEPRGDCSFESGAGSIQLVLPASLNMEVDLSTGMGTVSVDYNVDGQVSRREVIGVIGSGEEGSISAHSGTGSVTLISR
jgi:DUF4097 and DUF4098 domain-containing protein YvlB